MNNFDQRISHMDIGRLYFWTATINNWNRLLDEDKLKEIIISSLQYLVKNNKIEVYAFVIMPNHVHFIWQLMRMNGKEKHHTSFLKYTAHSFEKYLKSSDPEMLKIYKTNASNKQYEFWQRDSYAFELLKKETINQKMEYIHFNPISGIWNLCNVPSEYIFSSAAFYETGFDRFQILKHINSVL